MNAAEIVVREMQGNRGFKMRQLLAVRIREARKTPHCHSHGQVLPFDETSGNEVGVGVALSDFGYDPRDAWWGVPRIGSVELPVVAKHLGKLCKVRIQTKAHRYSGLIVIQAVLRGFRISRQSHFRFFFLIPARRTSPPARRTSNSSFLCVRTTGLSPIQRKARTPSRTVVCTSVGLNRFTTA
jgi:hypothetical protein